MATKNNTPKINVPSLPNTEVTQPNPVNENTEDTNTVNNTPDANADTPSNTDAPNNNDNVIVTLDEIESFTPDAINAALAEIDANHVAVNKLVSKMPAESITAMRAAFGITEDIDADKASVTLTLGGKVAPLMEALQSDDESTWRKVAEYIDLESLLEEVNATRAKIGMSALVLRVASNTRTRSSGNTDAPTRNSTGYMRPMTIVGTYKDHDVVWTASRDNIAVTVNKRVIHSGAQGSVSLSKIMEKVLIECGAGNDSRQNLPNWFRSALRKINSPLDVTTEVMLTSQDQVNAIADKLDALAKQTALPSK